MLPCADADVLAMTPIATPRDAQSQPRHSTAPVPSRAAPHQQEEDFSVGGVGGVRGRPAGVPALFEVAPPPATPGVERGGVEPEVSNPYTLNPKPCRTGGACAWTLELQTLNSLNA
jgi:hypothetical protein